MNDQGESAQLSLVRRAERSRNPERVHGRHETVELYADEFIKLSQVRPGKNPILEELKDSIERVGLLNSIDVARMDGPLLEEYIEFTNRVWGASRSMDEFAHLGEDGFYYPLVAGHTRHQAIEELEEEGRIEQYPIQTKVHTVHTVEDVLELQLGENLHSVPSMERRALAAVEHFTFGIMKGKWTSQDDYFAKHPERKMDKGVLRDGLEISYLPGNLQDYVFTKKVSFATGIELAKTARVLKKHVEFLKGAKFDDMDEETRKTAEDHIVRKLNLLAAKIAEKRLNAPAAKKVLAAERQRMNNEMFPPQEEGARATDAPDQEAAVVEFHEDSTLFDIMIAPEDTFEREMRETKQELRDLLHRYGNSPSTFAFELIELAGSVVDEETMQEVRADYEKSLRVGSKLLGKSSLHAVDVEPVAPDLFAEMAS